MSSTSSFMKNVDSSALISRKKLIEYPNYSATRPVTSSCLLYLRSGKNAASVISQINALRNLDLVQFIVLFEISIGPLFSINPDQNRQPI